MMELSRWTCKISGVQLERENFPKTIQPKYTYIHITPLLRKLPF